MIGIRLQGGLGNQMFQYAAAWTLADRLKCPLICASHTLGRRYGLIGHWLKADRWPEPDPRLPQLGLQQNGVLRAAFGCGPLFEVARLGEFAMPYLRRYLFPKTFTPKMSPPGDVREYELFDEGFFEQRRGTWLEGWYQSEGYFLPNADRVRQWYRPKPADAKTIARLMGEWPAPPERMVGIHVRRGDYAEVRDGLGEKDQGWLLPTGYYCDALGLVPKDAGIAIISDDPDWAAREFADWKPWVSRGNSPAVDMLLLSRCRWTIVANSTFSWWGGWLNTRPDRVVIAPRYHLGWRVQRWIPGGIAVADWHYLSV